MLFLNIYIIAKNNTPFPKIIRASNTIMIYFSEIQAIKKQNFIYEINWQ